MANTYIQRTPSTNGNQKKWTYSGWIKVDGKSDDGTYQYLLNCSIGSGYRYTYVCLRHGTIEVYGGVYSTSSSSFLFDVTTTRELRDPLGWYHVMVVYDSAQSTSTDRVKTYINGVQETSFQGYVGSNNSATFPSQNADTFMNVTTTSNKIGESYNGSMSHVHFCDGYAYQPSDFGSTDSVTGQWKINTSPSVSYGTNGFWLFKDDAVLTDRSSNTNDFTLGGGTLTKTQDCPDNLFATMNPLYPANSSLSFTNGNLHNGDQSPNDWQSIPGTLAAYTGKFYWEFKIESVWGSTSNTTHRHGIANLFSTLNHNPGNGDVAWTDDPYAIGWQNSNGIRYNNSVTSGYGTYVANDILMFAMDLTNKKLYVGKNGNWENSGDPTSGSTGTGAYSIPDLGLGGMWAPYSETKYGSDKVSWNIGNGFHKTTAVTTNSGNGYAGAEGNSIFTYQPPTGYSALNTKGLNQ
ncbi:spry domain protein [uncultured Mediterranean phage uvMED]|nr:spry domain protein [uncultured Mediterranean phage uvMED]BAR34742.1 spry domain protein [uncultured Mediterranean phage uvMED]